MFLDGASVRFVGQVVAARFDMKSVVGEVLHGNLGAAFIYRFSAVEVA